jgi:WD40 repeat protein
VTFWPRVKVWDVNTGLGRELPVHGEAIAVGFSPDGTTLAVALSQGVELWNSQTRQRITMCKGWQSGSSALTFSRDGRMLIAWANEKAWVWEVPSGKLLGTLTGHSLGFDQAAFSADGQTIATHLGGSFTLWNVRNSQELFSLKMGRLGYGSVRFSGDGQTLIVHKDKRPALVLRAPTLTEIDAAENEKAAHSSR